MQFWNVESFKFWEGDKLLAHYTPGMSYRLREGNERLRVLLFGGVLPEGPPVYTEQDTTLVEMKPGDTVEGWLNDGRMTLQAPAEAASGSVSGSAKTGGN